MPDAETVATVAVALACVFAFGAAATTLESSISTKPDDVIDLNFEELPIGEDTAENYKEQYKGESTAGDQGKGEGSSDGGGTDQAPEPSSDGDVEEPAQADQGTGGESGGSDSKSRETQGGSGGSGLRSLIGTALPLLKWLAVLLGVGLLVAVAYRYRRRILAVLGAFVGGTGAAAADDGVEWEPGDPANSVQAAWIELLERSGLNNPHARTPEECRDAAIDAGLDSDAARTITSLFRDVRYGDQPLTDGRAQRARESLERIRRTDRQRGVVDPTAGGERT